MECLGQEGLSFATQCRGLGRESELDSALQQLLLPELKRNHSQRRSKTVGRCPLRERGE